MRNKASWLVRAVAGVSLSAGITCAANAGYNARQTNGYNNTNETRTQETEKNKKKIPLGLKIYAAFIIMGMIGAIPDLIDEYLSERGPFFVRREGETNRNVTYNNCGNSDANETLEGDYGRASRGCGMGF